MSELLVAQCPFCQTRFRLSQEHLQAAGGSVRCGACLKVFDASPGATPPEAEAGAPDSGSAPQAAAAPERRDTLMIHDDMDLDDLDLEALGLDESILEEINPAGRVIAPVTEQRPDQARFQLESDPEPESELEPESGSEPEPETEAAPAAQPAADPGEASTGNHQNLPAEQDEESDPWDRLDEAGTGHIRAANPAFPAAEPAPTETDHGDSDLHEDFLATPTARDFELPPQPAHTAASSTPAGRTSADRETDSGIFLRDRPADIRAAQPQPTADKQPEPSGASDQRREPRLGNLIDLPDLVDEPVLLYQQPRARRSRYRPLWMALSILALLGLPAQAMYYNFSTLAHGEQTRPYLEKFCFLVGCDLPARVAIDLIRSSNLMVRPHPEYPNALAIDVILYNRAEFAQPFPVLRMIFNSTRGREVLSKQFRPDEYLGGELAGATLMPPQTPVHVALDMLDPGPEAAGYQLDFLSP